MLKLTIEIEGKSHWALLNALAEVRKHIRDEFIEGHEKTEDGQFRYHVTGDEE